MKVGFCVCNYSEKPVEEVVQIAASHGYECVELPCYEGNGQIDAADLLTGGKAAKLRRYIEEKGMTISSLSNHADSWPIMGPYHGTTDSICAGTIEERVAFCQQSMIRSAQLAAELGASAVVAFSGMENYGHINDWPEPNGWKYEEECFVEKWVPVLDKYQEYGLKVAFEPHPNNLVYDTQSALRILEVIDQHPAFAINLDPANILFSGIDVQCFVDALRGRIALVHAKDCEIVRHNLPKGGLNMYLQDGWGRLDRSFRFRVPGWGDVDWKGLISELYLTGYDGPFNYEHEDVIMSRADGDEKSIAFLKPLMIHAPYEGRNDKLFTK